MTPSQERRALALLAKGEPLTKIKKKIHVGWETLKEFVKQNDGKQLSPNRKKIADANRLIKLSKLAQFDPEQALTALLSDISDRFSTVAPGIELLVLDQKQGKAKVRYVHEMELNLRGNHARRSR